MKIVIDASMALAWLFERNKADEAATASRALLALADAEEAQVPTMWHIEIANGLLVGERRRVVTEAKVIDFLSRLSQLPISTDDMAPAGRRDIVMALAREHRLTAYDATYLELALRKNAALATFDIQLADAVRRAGGTVFGNV